MTRRRSTAATAAATVVALAAAVIVVALVRGGSVAGHGSQGPAPAVVAAPVVIESKPQPTVVAAAAPTAFTITGKAFTVKAHVCGMDGEFPLDPPGDQFHTVCWVRNNFGHLPSSVSTGTTYVLGHSWAAAPLVLNPLANFAMDHGSATPTDENGAATYPVPALNGYRIVLTTSQGTLTYTVRRAFTVAKGELPRVRTLWKNSIKNRVALITCAVHNGVDIDRNVVVYAYLTKVQPA